MRRAVVFAALGLAFACGCKKPEARPNDGPSEPDAAAQPSAPSPPRAPPRCREDGAELTLAGDDVVIGEGVAVNDAVFVGLIRRVDGKRVASVLRAPRSLDARTIVDLGPALETDRAPLPYVVRGKVWVAFFARLPDDAKATRREEIGKAPKTSPLAYLPGATRELRVVRVDDALATTPEGSVAQSVDESEAFDLAWPDAEGEPPLVAWDEDAPRRPGQLLADRGVVVVQRLRSGDKPRAVTPTATDAEAPRLLRKSGGYWLAWLAKKPEIEEDGAQAPESSRRLETPGEGRVHRWVELASLDEQGNLASPVVVVSSPRGHAAAFELVRAASPDAVSVLVADEAEELGEAGGRIARYLVSGGVVSAPSTLATGVSSAPFSLVTAGAVTAGAPGQPWLAWTDAAERTHGLPLGGAGAEGGLAADAGANGAAPPALEPALDGARLLAALAPDVFFAVADGRPATPTSAGRASAIVRLVCR